MIAQRLLATFVVTLLPLAGCGGNGCLPAVSANSASCPASVYIDAAQTDPLCLNKSGVAICRGDNDAVCYLCTGAKFSDGCVVKEQTQTITCVHSCSNC
jgi:hypothetical protein